MVSRRSTRRRRTKKEQRKGTGLGSADSSALFCFVVLSSADQYPVQPHLHLYVPTVSIMATNNCVKCSFVPVCNTPGTVLDVYVGALADDPAKFERTIGA